MVDEKPNIYEPQDTLRIPTYDEAISSRPSSSQSFLGSTEISHDAERQSLLNQRALLQGYEHPSPGSARSSGDFLPSSSGSSPRSSLGGLQREMTQMEVLDAMSEGNTINSRGSRFSKHFNNLTHSLSSMNLPFRQWLPSLDYIRARIPSLSEHFTMNWILVGRIFALLLVLSLAYLIFLSDIFTIRRTHGASQTYDPESVRAFVQDRANEAYIRQNSEHITSFDHVAGTEGNLYLAKWIEEIFHEAKLESVGLERFDVYLNYPKKGGRRVAIVEPLELAWEAIIDEDPAYENPSRDQTPVFHGHSRSGNVTGPLIYANYGSRQDFQWLHDHGIDLKGAIALVRYYGSQGDRALKVKAAELAGAIGCIIYSDPAEDGFRKGKVYPDGRYMPSDGVQRGSVSLMSWVVGDVLSSGFASLPDEARRDSKDSNSGLNNIPSIPLAWRDAQRLLQALKGHGEKLIGDWKGGIDEVDWWSGDQGSPIIHLRNEQDEVDRRPIYNVVGKINGVEQPEKSIIVGNHRDAWCFGATDPGSGTAVLLEVVRIFGELRKLGWRPLRTIEFASWDGEEYNLIGSTEHVEARIEDIRRNGVAYLNVDVAVSGTQFEAAASPVFEKALMHVLDRTTDPSSNNTLRSIWKERKSRLEGLGAGSDYVAFQDMAGTSSIDFGFGGPPYPYHSCYDNFDWMEKYGDPTFQYHKTVAQIWALLILEMADTRMLPFDMNAYSRAVRRYVEDLERYVNAKDGVKKGLSLKLLYTAADEFQKNAQKFHEWDNTWGEIFYGQGGFESNVMAIKRMSHNTRMANFETHLLDVDGGVSHTISFLPFPLAAQISSIPFSPFHETN